jgi:hypothetical protein
MSVLHVHGSIFQKMGTVGIVAPTVLRRGDLVRVVNGLATAPADAANTSLAVALDMFPDVEYEGTKARIDIGYLGEEIEVEMPFVDVGGGIAVADIGASFNILAANGGTVNLDANAQACFKVLRFGPTTVVGAATGTVIGSFLDAASF